MVERNPRINIGLPEGILNKLERYAKSRGAKSATEASYLLTRVLDDLDDEGKIPSESVSDLSPHEALELLIGFINSLIDTGSHNGYSLAEISEILGRDSDREIILLIEKVRDGNGDTHKKTRINQP